MDSRERRRIVVGGILILVIAGGVWGYVRLRESESVSRYGRSDSPRRASEIVRTETLTCDGEVYIFETIFTEEGYFNEIYKTARSQENFIVRLKSPRGGNLGVFSILTAPKKNCDRIYLTTIIAETDAPMARIFAWHLNEKTARELTISSEFSDSGVPFRGRDWISQDGERIIIAQQISPKKDNLWCDYRLLRLISLREDTSRMLFQLPPGETFDNGYSDLAPYCAGLNFGWLDESTIYYNVFDATRGVFDVATETNRPFLERRTLAIE